MSDTIDYAQSYDVDPSIDDVKNDLYDVSDFSVANDVSSRHDVEDAMTSFGATMFSGCTGRHIY